MTAYDIVRYGSPILTASILLAVCWIAFVRRPKTVKHGVTDAAPAESVYTKGHGDDLRDIQHGRYWHIANTYQSLPWQQKYALKTIIDREHVPIAELIEGLKTKGFADPKMMIVREVLNVPVLVKRPQGDVDTVMSTADAEVWVESSEVSLVLNKLFRESPLC